MDAKQFFKAHPKKEQVFQTSDGFLFPQEADAKNHAKSLKETGIKKFTNSIKVANPEPEVEEAIVGEAETATTAKKATAKKAEEPKPEAGDTK